MGTKPDFYYWEIVIMMRKFFIIFACDFLAQVSPEVQCLCGIIILITNIMFIIRFRPLKTDQANKVNIYSQIVHLLRMYIGLYYITDKDLDYISNNIPVNVILVSLIILS